MLNFLDSGGRCYVTVQQVDDVVYVVGQDSFSVARYDLSGWLGDIDQADPPMIECVDADTAWVTLQRVRRDCGVRRCGACAAWIFSASHVSSSPLPCAICGRTAT